MQRKKRPHREEDVDISRTIFLGGIPLISTEKLLIEYLSNFDAVEDVDIPRYTDTGISKGYAKVRLASSSGVRRVLAAERHVLGGLEVGILPWKSPQSYLRKKNREHKRKIYVRIPRSLDEKDLWDYFSTIGPVENVSIRTQPITNERRDFCYVIFQEKSAAESAVGLSPHKVKGATLFCEPSFRPDQSVKQSLMEKRINRGLLKNYVKADTGSNGPKPTRFGSDFCRNLYHSGVQAYNHYNSLDFGSTQLKISVGDKDERAIALLQKEVLGEESSFKKAGWSKHYKPTSGLHSSADTANLRERHKSSNVRFNVCIPSRSTNTLLGQAQ